MATDQVRMWRNADEDRVLLMAGQTSQDAIEPQGQYVSGVVTSQPMRLRRGRERRVVLPGQLVACDPSSAHAGTAVDARLWTARPERDVSLDELAAAEYKQAFRHLTRCPGHQRRTGQGTLRLPINMVAQRSHGT